jgi:septin family protein
MVAGAHGTGKTSLLKLFLDTSIISPTATPEQKQSVEAFLSTSRKSTKALRTACVEIAENRFDRVLLTLIDTPGLDFTEGKELRCERDVTSLVKYLDSQYDETMGEESKVVRQSKGDQHVHLYVFTVIFECPLELTSGLISQVHLPN